MGAGQAQVRAGAEGAQGEAAELRSCRWLLMRYHDSDHRAFVLRLETDPQGVKQYFKVCRTLPETNRPKEKAERGVIFKKPVKEAAKPENQERPQNSWIWPSTWFLVDHCAAMRKESTLSRREAQYLARKIKRSIKEDRKHR